MGKTLAIISVIALTAAAAIAQATTDFSGEWKLNAGRSEVGRMPSPPETSLKIDQSALTMTVWANSGEKITIYPLDSRTEKRTMGDISYSTQTKWEGAAMLVNTLVAGVGKNHTIMERWKLSRGGATLTIRRTIVDSRGETESTLIYELPGARPAPVQAERTTLSESVVRPSRAEEDFVVESGTRMLLHLRNAVDTKHSAAGDRVYLETSYPVFVNQQLVIPQGSYVMGTVVAAERGGKVKGKSALNIRFDSVTLPNGVTRDFRARVGSSENAQVDGEGRIKGESGKGRDAGTVAGTTATGAGVGAVAGGLKGLGVGSAVGAAAGLAAVLLSRGPDVVLRPGTSVEMVLDRDLRFTADELTRWRR